MKKIFLTLLGISALLLGSCSQEQKVDFSPAAGKGLKLSVEVEKATRNDGAATRASVASEEGENTISSLYLLFFDPATDLYLDHVEVAMPAETGNMGMNVDTEVDLTGTSLIATNAYNILAIANISDNSYIEGTVAGWMSQWTGKSESEVISAAGALIPTKFDASELLMHGRMAKPATETQVHMLLERDVVRFDVVNNTRTDYDLVSVSVWNGYPTTMVFEPGIMDYTANVERSHGNSSVDNSNNIKAGETDILADIKGGLYAFENQIGTPAKNDKVTTCLIVGLGDRSNPGAKPTYYRVNMTNASGVQAMKRNHVYNLTITGVEGPGASSEQIAYLGESNKLVYTINQWNVDDNGLIVQDEYSILSIPTKTVILGGKASTVELSIHTFSSLPSPAPLTVRSQTYRPVTDDIQATLDGNTLVVKATALRLDETQRNGVIVLSYAGLEISLNVEQAGEHDNYLRVTLPDGGIPRFAPYGGLGSGLISVQATGPWTAKLYMTGFSFDPSTAINPVKELTSTSNLITDDPNDRTVKKFRVYTHSHNLDLSARQAYIVVTLDLDPDKYSAVVLVSQDNVKSIGLRVPVSGNYNTPDTSGDPLEAGFATFIGAPTGAGEGADLVPGIAGNSDKFFVYPGMNDNNEVLPWNVALVASGTSNDTGYFEIAEKNYDSANPNNNYVIVKAKGTNISGRNCVAALRVYTDPSTYSDITLVQRPVEWNLPTPPASIHAVGGESGELLLDAPTGMHYTVEIESTSGATDHFAYVVDPGDATGKYSKLKSRPVGEPFIVGFPKMIYPNLYSAVSAIVKVTVTESGESKTFVITQNPPTQNRVDILNVGMDWGGISNTPSNSTFTANWYGFYCASWADSFHAATNFGPGGTVKTVAPVRLASAEVDNFATVWPQVNSTASFVHYTRPGEYNATYEVTANSTIWSWINGTGEYAGNEGVLLVNAEEAATAMNARQFDSSHIPGMMGLSGSDWNGTYVLNSADNRVMNYIATTGPFSHETSPASWTTGGSTSYLDIASVEAIEGAVPVLVNANGYCAMMIDPKRRIVVKVDSEMVADAFELQGAMRNVQAWLINTAQWGSHFSEYFWDSPRYLMPVPTPQP